MFQVLGAASASAGTAASNVARSFFMVDVFLWSGVRRGGLAPARRGETLAAVPPSAQCAAEGITVPVAERPSSSARAPGCAVRPLRLPSGIFPRRERSEEHTSELQ